MTSSSSSSSQVKTYKISNVEDSLFENSSPDARKVIVEIGCSVYRNLSSITTIRNKNDEEAKTEIIQEYDKEIKRIKEDSLENEQCLLYDTKSLKSELNMIRESLREYYDTRNDRDMSRMEEMYKDTISVLKDNIKGLEDIKSNQESQLKKYEKKDGMKTVERGIEGEKSVIDYLGRTFTEGELHNTTKKGSYGDVHYKYKDIDILIEVKNKDNITLDDINKFKRDILETKSQGGVFVSMKHGVSIPCHSIYDVEWINNVPLIYITNFEICESMLYTSIKTIHFYVMNSLKDDSEEENTKRLEFDKLLDIVKCFSYSLEDLIIDTKRINDRIVKLQNIIKDKVDLRIGIEDKSYEDTVLELMRSYELANNELPSEEYITSHHGITKKIIKDLGGIKEIKKNIIV